MECVFLYWEVLQALSLLIERERPGVLDGDSEGPLDPAPCARQGVLRGRGLKMERYSSEFRVWNLDVLKIKTWILMLDPDSSESCRLRGSGGWGTKKPIEDRLLAP